MIEGWVIDSEGDSLTPTLLHCLAAKKTTGGKIHATTSYDQMRKLLTEAKYLICHNIQRFDVPVFERLLNIKITARLIDTLALSWYLEPQRQKHGLEWYGLEFGVKKPVILDWQNLTSEQYIHRCTEDVEINDRLWKHQWRQLLRIYGSEEEALRLLDYLEFKMDCAREQERSRWKLDIKLAETTLEKLSAIREQKLVELVAAMPKITKYETKDRPKVPFKADGTVSVHGQKWFELLREQGQPDDAEFVKYIVDIEDGNPKAPQQVKDWLVSLGWVPRKFKHTRDKKTGDLRSIPQIRDAETGELCESVQELFDKEPALETLSGLSILNHRIPILEGLLRTVDDKGYVYAGIAGLTNTLRFKHAVVVNFPKADKPYGKEIRGCLIAPTGYELCGADMSALEDKIKQHFIYPHDPEYVKALDTPGYDPHLAIAVLSKMMTQDDHDFYVSFNKDTHDPIRYKVLKTVRGKAKNVNYAGQYGAGPPRIALTGNIPLEEAKLLHETYWKLNWAIKVVAKEQVWKLIDDQMWLFNPIAKLWYSLRFEKDIFSTLVQGTASYVFDLWVRNFREVRTQLTGQFHDEVVLAIKKGNRDNAKALLMKAIDKTNEQLKLNKQLEIDIQFGDCYADIH